MCARFSSGSFHNAAPVRAAPAAAGHVFFDREATIAKAGFNRWLVPPAALAIHLCIGMAYGFSVFWVPLGRAVAVARGAPKPIACPGDATSFAGKLTITGHALFATDCDWTQFDLGWMYGGGFATVPAYLADLFGVQYVGAIHGRLLTAWSTAGIVGPVLVNYLHDSRVAAGVPCDHVYDVIFYALTGLLVVGLAANALISACRREMVHSRPERTRAPRRQASDLILWHRTWRIRRGSRGRLGAGRSPAGLGRLYDPAQRGENLPITAPPRQPSRMTGRGAAGQAQTLNGPATVNERSKQVTPRGNGASLTT